MSVHYTAYLFIGAKVPVSHFYEEGEKKLSCYAHGQQEKPFCGNCGKKCTIEAEFLWTEAMLRAAKAYEQSPEELWESLMEDGGKYFRADRGDIGFWRFGYENDNQLFGAAVAEAGSDDRPNNDKDTLDGDQLQSYLNQVDGAFKAFGIELPVKVKAVMNCG